MAPRDPWFAPTSHHTARPPLLAAASDLLLLLLDAPLAGGMGDTGPGPLVALHGTPQRETSAAQRGLCRRSDYATHGSPSMATSLLRVLLWDTL